MSEQNIDPAISLPRAKENTRSTATAKDTHSVSKRLLPVTDSRLFVSCLRDYKEIEVIYDIIMIFRRLVDKMI